METNGQKKALEQVAAQHGRAPIPLAPSDLGDLLGLSTAEVDRALARLEASGVIRCTDQGVVVIDPHRLCQCRGI